MTARDELGNKVATLVTTRPDAEIAADFKRRLVDSQTAVIAILDEMKAAGLEGGVSVGVGPLGNYVIQQINIIKRF